MPGFRERGFGGGSGCTSIVLVFSSAFVAEGGTGKGGCANRGPVQITLIRVRRRKLFVQEGQFLRAFDIIC